MKYKITLDGRTYEVNVTEGEAILVDEYTAAAPAAPAAPAPAPVPAAAPAAAAAPAPAPAAPAAPAAAGEVIPAPMPGTILSVNVAAGQAVKRGQVMFILEAMKMENEIVASRDGTINQVAVSKGAAVNTGDTLAVLG